MNNDSFVAIDFETANAKRVSACSLGVCFYDRGVLQKKRHFLIHPIGEYAAMNMKIHGITPVMTADAPTFEEIYPLLQEYFESYPVMGYSKFDRSVLNSLIEYYDLPISGQIRYIDVCEIAKERLPELPNHKLPTVAKHFGLGQFKHHNAEDDAVKCAEVFLRLLKCESRKTEELSTEGAKSRFIEAFPRFLDCIMDDGMIDYKEAIELQCFLDALAFEHPVLDKLREVLSEVLEDGDVSNDESNRLMLILASIAEEMRLQTNDKCPVCEFPLAKEMSASGDVIVCPWCYSEFEFGNSQLDEEFSSIFAG